MMNQEKIAEIGRKLTVFNFAKLQDLVTLSILLEREEISLEQLKEYLATVREFNAKAVKEREKIFKEREERWLAGTRRCPTCMKPLALRAINILKGKGNREGYTCHWFCQDDNCNFEEYTHENFQEVYKKIMGGRENGVK